MNATQETFVDSVDQDQTTQNLQYDLIFTLSDTEIPFSLQCVNKILADQLGKLPSKNTDDRLKVTLPVGLTNFVDNVDQDQIAQNVQSDL